SVSVVGDFVATGNCSGLIEGECALDLLFAPTAAGERTGSLVVNTEYGTATLVLSGTATAAISQTISFAAPADQGFGAPPITVSATASSGLPVVLASETASVCTVAGSVITLVGPGTCTINANQGGDADYAPAPQVSRSFTVTKGAQTITFSSLADRTIGDPPFTISAVASSSLPVAFSSLTPLTCTVSGGTVTLIAAGT